MPLVKLFGSLRLNSGIKQLEIPGETVRAVIEQLCAAQPALCAAVYREDQSGLRLHLRIMLNGRDIEVLQGLETPVAVTDTLAIVPPIAGGRGKPPF